MTTQTYPCCVNFCPSQATTESETGEVGHWLVTAHYCHEHARALREGTPLGPLGLDPSRLEVHSKGTEEPAAGDPYRAVGPA